MLYLGASGFSYDDWVGNFYPAGMPRREWLAYYAREFNTCEVNSTFYALPKPSSLKTMAEKTGKDWLHHQDLGFCCVDEPPLPEIKELESVAENTFIFANNHWRGQSISTIRQLRMMLN